MTSPATGPVDEPPKDGVWRDWDGAQLSREVVEAGEKLGANAVDYIEIDGEVREL